MAGPSGRRPAPSSRSRRRRDTLIAIGLGSNLGDREAHLRSAITGLAVVGIVGPVSGMWETEPIGGPQQGLYLNAVAVVRTPFGPRNVLEACLHIERENGRVRRQQWMPRTLDLDLLLYGEAVVDLPELRVPHPRMGERRFVLEPLAEVWPGYEIPGVGRIADLLDGVAEQHCVRLAGPDWAQ